MPTQPLSEDHSPCSQLFQTVRTAGAGLLDRLTPEEAPVSQLAGDPAISEAPPMEDANITEFAVRADREILTGGTVALTYYNQGEEPLGEPAFWTRSDLRLWVRSHRPVYAGLLSDRSGHQPGGNGSVAYEHGYCAPGSGSYLSIGRGGLPGICSVLSRPGPLPGELRQDLSSGHIFVALMGSGHFTSSGHFILLRGVTLDGKILVADPNSRERSLAAWDPEVILAELSQSRSSGAPLWRFSTLNDIKLPLRQDAGRGLFFPPNSGLTQLW